VDVYNLKIYNENFEINILNWCNIFTSKIENYDFYRSMELKMWIKFNSKYKFKKIKFEY
jgi:hypothetical protein